MLINTLGVSEREFENIGIDLRILAIMEQAVAVNCIVNNHEYQEYKVK